MADSGQQPGGPVEIPLVLNLDVPMSAATTAAEMDRPRPRRTRTRRRSRNVDERDINAALSAVRAKPPIPSAPESTTTKKSITEHPSMRPSSTITAAPIAATKSHRTSSFPASAELTPQTTKLKTKKKDSSHHSNTQGSSSATITNDSVKKRPRPPPVSLPRVPDGQALTPASVSLSMSTATTKPSGLRLSSSTIRVHSGPALTAGVSGGSTTTATTAAAMTSTQGSSVGNNREEMAVPPRHNALENVLFFLFEYKCVECPLGRQCRNKVTCPRYHHASERRRYLLYPRHSAECSSDDAHSCSTAASVLCPSTRVSDATLFGEESECVVRPSTRMTSTKHRSLSEAQLIELHRSDPCVRLDALALVSGALSTTVGSPLDYPSASSLSAPGATEVGIMVGAGIKKGKKSCSDTTCSSSEMTAEGTSHHTNDKTSAMIVDVNAPKMIRLRYSEEPCINVKPEGTWLNPRYCMNGDQCQYSHTLLEQMYHPNIYKTSMCAHFTNASMTRANGRRCNFAYYCTHAHGTSELRSSNSTLLGYQAGGGAAGSSAAGPSSLSSSSSLTGARGMRSMQGRFRSTSDSRLTQDLNYSSISSHLSRELPAYQHPTLQRPLSASVSPEYLSRSQGLFNTGVMSHSHPGMFPHHQPHPHSSYVPSGPTYPLPPPTSAAYQQIHPVHPSLLQSDPYAAGAPTTAAAAIAPTMASGMEGRVRSHTIAELELLRAQHAVIVSQRRALEAQQLLDGHLASMARRGIHHGGSSSVGAVTAALGGGLTRCESDSTDDGQILRSACVTRPSAGIHRSVASSMRDRSRSDPPPRGYQGMRAIQPGAIPPPLSLTLQVLDESLGSSLGACNGDAHSKGSSPVATAIRDDDSTDLILLGDPPMSGPLSGVFSDADTNSSVAAASPSNDTGNNDNDGNISDEVIESALKATKLAGIQGMMHSRRLSANPSTAAALGGPAVKIDFMDDRTLGSSSSVASEEGTKLIHSTSSKSEGKGQTDAQSAIDSWIGFSPPTERGRFRRRSGKSVGIHPMKQPYTKQQSRDELMSERKKREDDENEEEMKSDSSIMLFNERRMNEMKQQIQTLDKRLNESEQRCSDLSVLKDILKCPSCEEYRFGRDHVLVPCGHLVCQPCAFYGEPDENDCSLDAASKQHLCPLCDTVIEHIVSLKGLPSKESLAKAMAVNANVMSDDHPMKPPSVMTAHHSHHHSHHQHHPVLPKVLPPLYSSRSSHR